MCLKTTSAQLPTVSKSASNGTSAAFECLDEPPSACVACFHLAASTSTRVARFELSGTTKDEAVDGRTNCKLVPKRRKSPNSVERERRLRSQTLHPFLALFQGKIRSRPCEFKGDNCHAQP